MANLRSSLTSTLSSRRRITKRRQHKRQQRGMISLQSQSSSSSCSAGSVNNHLNSGESGRDAGLLELDLEALTYYPPSVCGEAVEEDTPVGNNSGVLESRPQSSFEPRVEGQPKNDAIKEPLAASDRPQVAHAAKRSQNLDDIDLLVLAASQADGSDEIGVCSVFEPSGRALKRRRLAATWGNKLWFLFCDI